MTKTKQHTILITEDDESISQMIKLYLERYNFNVLQATTGTQTLTIFKQQKPDLILLDLNIPEIDGIKVCKAIREFQTSR